MNDINTKYDYSTHGMLDAIKTINPKKAFSILGMLIGIGMIIAGAISYSNASYGNWGSTSEDISKEYFGGDYYTEQHNATRIAADRIKNNGHLIAGVGWATVETNKTMALFMIFTGGIAFCAFGFLFATTLSKKETAAEQPMPPQQPANTPYSAPKADRSLGIQTIKPQVVFTCPGCKEKIIIEKDKITIGSETSCPHCGKVIEFEEFEE